MTKEEAGGMTGPWKLELEFKDKEPGDSRRLFALLTGQTEEQVQDDWDWASEKRRLRAMERDMIWGLY